MLNLFLVNEPNLKVLLLTVMVKSTYESGGGGGIRPVLIPNSVFPLHVLPPAWDAIPLQAYPPALNSPVRSKGKEGHSES